MEFEIHNNFVASGQIGMQYWAGAETWKKSITGFLLHDTVLSLIRDLWIPTVVAIIITLRTCREK